MTYHYIQFTNPESGKGRLARPVDICIDMGR